MLLSAQNLSCSFGAHRVFENITFEVKKGEMLSVTGPNGSGKTSLLKICAGLLAPSSGQREVAVNSKVIPLPSRLVGFITPSLRWYGSLTLEENSSFYFCGKEPRDEFERIMQLFGLARYADTPFDQLSSGNAQRFSCAAVLASGAKLLLLDEPSVHLDEKGREIFLQLLDEKRKDSAVVIATHDRDECAAAVRSVTLG